MSLLFLCRFNMNLCSWKQVLFTHVCWAVLIRWCFFSISTVVRGLLVLSFDDFLQFTINLLIQHLNLKAFHNENRCVKSVQIRIFFWSVFSCIQTRKNSVFRHFSRNELFWNFIILVIWLNQNSKDFLDLLCFYFYFHSRCSIAI